VRRGRKITLGTFRCEGYELDEKGKNASSSIYFFSGEMSDIRDWMTSWVFLETE
jgi:hypothetical protein